MDPENLCSGDKGVSEQAGRGRLTGESVSGVWLVAVTVGVGYRSGM